MTVDEVCQMLMNLHESERQKNFAVSINGDEEGSQDVRSVSLFQDRVVVNVAITPKTVRRKRKAAKRVIPENVLP